MGLLDSIVGAVSGQLQGQADAGGSADLIGSLLRQVGGGQGLAGLVEQLTRGGLGEIVQSWVSTGANLPVSAQQIEQGLGGDLIGQLAQQFGLNPAQLSQQLAQQLPQVVDGLTPQGQLPSGGMEDLLGQLSGLLQR